MTVVFVESQFRVSAGRSEMTGMILAVVMATAADARQVTIPVPDEFVKRLLSLSDEIAQRLNRLPAFGLALTLNLLDFLLFPLSFCLRSIIRYFSVATGAFKRADELAVASGMEPFFTY